jgi:predicted dehydrogenase
MLSRSQFKVGIIGYGSIGQRHCENLVRLGVSDITLFREKGKRNQHGFKELYDKQAFLSDDYDFIILSNPTAFHFKYLESLIPRQVNLLVEKPIAATSDELDRLKILLTNYKATGMCAYNMRFHPCVKKVKEIIDDQTIGKIYSARFFVGQYLPDWHPGKDYRSSYSSIKNLGGGVVLDLIHEIDLAGYLCGPVKDRFHAMVGKVSDLEIETEDLAEIHYQSSMNAFVSVHLDYLTRGYSRYFEIYGEKGRIFCDLFKNELQLLNDRGEIVGLFGFTDFNRNDMYHSLMDYYLMNIEAKTSPCPSLTDGLASLEIALTAKSKSYNYE